MLQAQPNKRVLIMCHENITINHYSGDNRSCLVSNCLFRMGGSACIMSNRCGPGTAGNCTSSQCLSGNRID